jgi:hypothetical protein
MNGGLRLVRYLQRRFAVPTDNVVGHAMANGSPMFHDRLGRVNDHGDWRRGAVTEFRRRLDDAQSIP